MGRKSSEVKKKTERKKEKGDLQNKIFCFFCFKKVKKFILKKIKQLREQ